MSGAVFRKTLRDAALLLTLLGVGLVLFDILAARMLIEAHKELPLVRMWLERPFVRMMMRMALGADLAGDLTSTSLATFILVHPVYFALAWTLLLAIGTGILAGEVGRGTADLLLALPVSRRGVYVSTSLVLVLAAVLVSAAPLLGLWLGQHIWSLPEPLDFHRLWRVPVNLLALNVCLAGLGTLVSACTSRRGKALGVLLAGILVSDLINVLAQFWEFVQHFDFLGFLYYYRPLLVVRNAALPLREMSILLAVGLGAWLVGLWHFSRRDIPAV